MRDKKKVEDEKTAERKALERHVDAMMDPKLPDAPVADALVEVPAPVIAEKPVAEPAKTAKTAPQLSARLRKRAGVSEESAKPISIKQLDEITEKISSSDTGGKPEKDKPEEPEKSKTDEPIEPIQPDDITERSTDLDDARTDEAVDDIVSHEGDVMLAVTDATAAQRNRQIEEASGKREKKGGFATFIWFMVFVIAVVALVLLGLLITGGNVNGPK